MLNAEDNIDSKADVITDYINFCTDPCIPIKTVKKMATTNHG